MEVSFITPLAIGVATVATAVASAIIGAVTVMWKMSYQFVTNDQCNGHIAHCSALRDSKRETSDQYIASVAKELSQLRKSMDDKHREAKQSSEIQYHMLRSLVAHNNDLTPEQRESILNAKQRRFDDHGY